MDAHGHTDTSESGRQSLHVHGHMRMRVRGREGPVPRWVVCAGARAAPEVIANSRTYDGKLADVWSSGVMLYVMLFCEYPFERPEDAGDPHRFQKVPPPAVMHVCCACAPLSGCMHKYSAPCWGPSSFCRMVHI